MLQAVAVIFKRGTVDTPSANRENLFNDVTHLISSGNLSMVSVQDPCSAVISSRKLHLKTSAKLQSKECVVSIT